MGVSSAKKKSLLFLGCSGICGNFSVGTRETNFAGCWCDEYCGLYQDCCTDFSLACPAQSASFANATWQPNVTDPNASSSNVTTTGETVDFAVLSDLTVELLSAAYFGITFRPPSPTRRTCERVKQNLRILYAYLLCVNFIYA